MGEVLDKAVRMETLLREAAEQFRYYETQHKAKAPKLKALLADCTNALEHDGLTRRLRETEDKAAVNGRLAQKIERELAS